MASIDDLADLIAQHRATLERAFESELARLRMTYGDRLIGQALARASERFTPESGHRPPPPLANARGAEPPARRPSRVSSLSSWPSSARSSRGARP
jgi:hypothetical protein